MLNVKDSRDSLDSCIDDYNYNQNEIISEEMVMLFSNNSIQENVPMNLEQEMVENANKELSLAGEEIEIKEEPFYTENNFIQADVEHVDCPQIKIEETTRSLKEISPASLREAVEIKTEFAYEENVEDQHPLHENLHGYLNVNSTFLNNDLNINTSNNDTVMTPKCEEICASNQVSMFKSVDIKINISDENLISMKVNVNPLSSNKDLPQLYRKRPNILRRSNAKRMKADQSKTVSSVETVKTDLMIHNIVPTAMSTNLNNSSLHNKLVSTPISNISNSEFVIENNKNHTGFCTQNQLSGSQIKLVSSNSSQCHEVLQEPVQTFLMLPVPNINLPSDNMHIHSGNGQTSSIPQKTNVILLKLTSNLNKPIDQRIFIPQNLGTPPISHKHSLNNQSTAFPNFKNSKNCFEASINKSDANISISQSETRCLATKTDRLQIAVVQPVNSNVQGQNNVNTKSTCESQTEINNTNSNFIELQIQGSELVNLKSTNVVKKTSKNIQTQSEQAKNKKIIATTSVTCRYNTVNQISHEENKVIAENNEPPSESSTPKPPIEFIQVLDMPMCVTSTNLTKDPLEMTEKQIQELKNGKQNLPTASNTQHNDSLIREILLEKDTEIKLEYIKFGRPQPDMKTLMSVRNHSSLRRFNVSYYDRADWLAGCEGTNKLYCWPCIFFSKKKTLFGTYGYNDLFNLLGSIKSHCTNTEHNDAVKLFNEYVVSNLHPSSEECLLQYPSQYKPSLPLNPKLIPQHHRLVSLNSSRIVPENEASNTVVVESSLMGKISKEINKGQSLLPSKSSNLSYLNKMPIEFISLSEIPVCDAFSTENPLAITQQLEMANQNFSKPNQNETLISEILKLPIKKNSIEKLKYIKLGRPQPELPDLTSVKREKGRSECVRHFKVHNYEKADWLTGCVHANKLYCWPCIFFNPDKVNFNSYGICDLNNLPTLLKKHSNNTEHNDAVKEFNEYVVSNLHPSERYLLQHPSQYKATLPVKPKIFPQHHSGHISQLFKLKRRKMKLLKYIKLGRPQPELPDLTSVKREKGRSECLRRFNMHYYERVDWLTGCALANKLYCWPCIFFNSDTVCLNTLGFNDLNNLASTLRRHSSNSDHNDAVKELNEYVIKHVPPSKRCLLEYPSQYKKTVPLNPTTIPQTHNLALLNSARIVPENETSSTIAVPLVGTISKEMDNKMPTESNKLLEIPVCDASIDEDDPLAITHEQIHELKMTNQNFSKPKQNETRISEILKLPIKKKSIEKLKYIKLGRPKPELPDLTSVKLEKGRSECIRHFKEHNYEKADWLTGCVHANKLYCWACIFFNPYNTSFNTSGHSDLNNLSNTLRRHSSNSEHNDAVKEFNEYVMTHLHPSERCLLEYPSQYKANFPIKPKLIPQHHSLVSLNSKRIVSEKEASSPIVVESSLMGKISKEKDNRQLEPSLSANSSLNEMPTESRKLSEISVCETSNNEDPLAITHDQIHQLEMENQNFLQPKQNETLISEILKLPIKKNSIEKLKYIKLGRPKPELLSLTSVKREKGRPECVRYFSMQNYERVDWLTGCAHAIKLYCWPCIFFNSDKVRLNTYGFNDVNNLVNTLKRHSNNSDHNDAVKEFNEFVMTNLHPSERCLLQHPSQVKPIASYQSFKPTLILG